MFLIRSLRRLIMLSIMIATASAHEGYHHRSSNTQQIEHMPSATAAAGNHTAAAALAGPQHPCMMAPNNSACSNYTYPRELAAQDIHSLCSAMPFMAACSVAKACNASGAGPDAVLLNLTAGTVNSTASKSTSNVTILLEPNTTEMESGDMSSSSSSMHGGAHNHAGSNMHGVVPATGGVPAFHSSSVTTHTSATMAACCNCVQAG